MFNPNTPDFKYLGDDENIAFSFTEVLCQLKKKITIPYPSPKLQQSDLEDFANQFGIRQ